MRTYKNHIMTDRGITLIFTDGIHSLSRGNSLFEEVRDALNDGDVNKACSLVDIEGKINRRSGGKFRVENGVIVIESGDPLPILLADSVMDFIDAGEDCTPLCNLWSRLSKNPDPAMREELFPFLSHSNIPITNDGCFIVYKRVRENYTDTHTGRMQIVLGVPVKMSRRLVDPDRHNTCSAGLHVAAFNYANTFYPNGVLLECKVDPEHVVAIPEEYDNEKMRVCEYLPLKECAGPREEIVYPDDDSFADYQRPDDEEYDEDIYVDEDDVDAEADTEIVTSTATRPIDDEQVLRETINVDSRGRATVKAELIKNLKNLPDKQLNLQIVDGKILIAPPDPTAPPMTYGEDYWAATIDQYSNIKIPAHVLKRAGLDGIMILRAMGMETHITIDKPNGN